MQIKESAILEEKKETEIPTKDDCNNDKKLTDIEQKKINKEFCDLLDIINHKSNEINFNFNEDQNFNEEENFESILTDEINEGLTIKNSVCYNSKNQNNNKSKSQLEKLSFNIDSMDKNSLKNFDKKCKNGNNKLISISNKADSIKKNIKLEQELDNVSNQKAVNAYNQNNIINNSNLKKSNEKENLPVSLYDENSVNHNYFNKKNQEIKLQNKSSNNEIDKHNFYGLVKNNADNYVNDNNFNTENNLKSDIIMDRITKQPCCSNVYIEEKCTIF